MKKTSITLKASAAVLAIAMATAVPAVAIAMSISNVGRHTVLASVDDNTKNTFFDYYDSCSAFLMLHGNELPDDVRLSLESARSTANATIGDEDGYASAIAGMRVSLRIAESTYAGIPVDANAAPDFVIGTYGYNRVNGINTQAANTVASIYATNRGLPPTMIATQLQNNFVERLYSTIYGRTADAAGRDAYVYQLANGTSSAAGVAKNMLNSSEFASRNLSNTEFVKVLYRTFLDRESDPAGLNNWVNALNNGATRDSVIDAFAHADEFTAMCSYYGLDI